MAVAFGWFVELILWLMVVGWVAALVIPALAGKPDETPGAGLGMLGTLVVAYFLAKRRHAKRP